MTRFFKSLIMSTCLIKFFMILYFSLMNCFNVSGVQIFADVSSRAAARNQLEEPQSALELLQQASRQPHPHQIVNSKRVNYHTEKSVEEMISSLPIKAGMVRFATSKPTASQKEYLAVKTTRSKRTVIYSDFGGDQVENAYATELVQDVCPSTSEWVAKKDAIDPYGNKVNIVQRIPINGTVVNQYFYETFCATGIKYEIDDFFGTTYRRVSDSASMQCKGIDKSAWQSRCRENYIWTYGKVVTSTGETGWSVIAIRGSCGCAIWPRKQDRMLDKQTGRGRRVSSARSNLVAEKMRSNDPFLR